MVNRDDVERKCRGADLETLAVGERVTGLGKQWFSVDEDPVGATEVKEIIVIATATHSRVVARRLRIFVELNIARFGSAYCDFVMLKVEFYRLGLVAGSDKQVDGYMGEYLSFLCVGIF